MDPRNGDTNREKSRNDLVVVQDVAEDNNGNTQATEGINIARPIVKRKRPSTIDSWNYMCTPV